MPEASGHRGLRVLMTADAVGGVFSYSLNLARELCRRGASVSIACMGPLPSSDQRRDAERIADLRLLTADFALEWQDDPWCDVERAGDWLLSVAREFEPDVVHLNGYVHASLDWPAPTLLVAHSCVLSWWQAVYGEAAPERYDVYRERVARGLDAAQAVVAPSAAMMESLRRFYGYRGESVVIPNGVPLAHYFPRPKSPFFLAAGRAWDHAKNTSLIARVAERLPWPVTLVGDGAPELAPGTPLVQLGRLSSVKLAQLMSEASVFLHPARYEPFGLAPLEAACSGAALVLGRIDSLQEIWGPAALYVAPDDEDELVRVAWQLAEDSVFRHGMAKAARARARDFSVELMADRYMALYLGLISQVPGRGARERDAQAVQVQA